MNEIQKCTFKHCENQGVPQTGFNFYVCDSCFDELDRLLKAGYAEREQRHANN